MKKNIIYSLFFVMFCNSCNLQSTKAEKYEGVQTDSITPVNRMPQKITNNNDTLLKFFKKNVNNFDFFKQELMSKENLLKLDSCKVNPNSTIYQEILKTNNYYNLNYFSNIEDLNHIKVFVLYGYYEYYEHFILVTYDYKNNEYIDHYIIGESISDGGDFYFKKSDFNDGVFESSFVKGERSLSSPKDTIIYSVKGKSRISIRSNGKIKEDTVKVKSNFIEIREESFIINYF